MRQKQYLVDGGLLAVLLGEAASVPLWLQLRDVYRHGPHPEYSLV